jgi:CubicO group peptidase (beta-lactamase class C family)
VPLPRLARAQPALEPGDIDPVVNDALRLWNVPGAAVAIVSGDRVYVKGYGLRDARAKDRVTADTLFALGSCSKPFTSLLLALLVDDGKLNWDDPVRRHLEYFRLADPLADRDVTLRDLLCHRTGVDSHDLLWYRAPWGQEEMIRKVGKLQPSKSFRSTFQYQTILYAAAGQAGAAAAGESWQALMHKRVCTPLGMTNTVVTEAERKRLSNCATPHKLTADGKIVPLAWYEFREANPAGSVCSTARDLARFLSLQLGEGAYQGKQLVSAESLLETRTPQFALPVKGPVRLMNPYTLQMSYGMGWVIEDYRGRLLNVHGGAIDGFRAQLTLVPDAHLGIAVLCNLQGTHLQPAVTNTLIDQLLGLRRKDWNAHYLKIQRDGEDERKAEAKEREARRHKGTKPSRKLSAYVGTYEDPAYGTARVTLEGGRLVWHWGSFDAPLEHFHYDTFTARHDHLIGAQVVFILDADGDVMKMEALDREFRRTEGK